MKQAYEVVLQNDNESVPCGNMYVTYIQRYLHNLSKNRSIPVDSCIYDINARFFQYDEAKVHIDLQGTTRQFKEQPDGCLQIYLRNKSCQKCLEHCLRNIHDGKCTDEFMLNNVCKIFFPNKYNNTKQR